MSERDATSGSATRRRARKPAAGADAPDPEAAEPGFEAALERLESLVEQLEDGDLPLEQALSLFEEGVAVTRRCAEQLARAERRVEALVREGGQWVERPFDPEGDEG